jgi:hypothetical protein
MEVTMSNSPDLKAITKKFPDYAPSSAIATLTIVGKTGHSARRASLGEDGHQGISPERQLWTRSVPPLKR